MADWKADTGQKIERMYAWIATEADGGEGVIGTSMMIAGREMFVPLIGADRARMESYRDYAKVIRSASNKPIRLVVFSARTILEDAP